MCIHVQSKYQIWSKFIILKFNFLFLINLIKHKILTKNQNNIKFLNSGKIDQETASCWSSFNGKSASHCEACARINLFATWWKCIRLEINSCRYYAWKFHKFHCHIQYRRYYVSKNKKTLKIQIKFIRERVPISSFVLYFSDISVRLVCLRFL